MRNKLMTGLTVLSLATTSLTLASTAFAQSASVSPSASATATSAGTATVRVVHASTDAPAVDVYVDDKKTLSALTYRRVTGYISLPAGKHSIKVYPTTARGTGTPTTAQDVDLNAGWDYTVAATGQVSAIQLKVFSDNLNLPGQAKTNLRVYHLSSDAPSINIVQKGGDIVARNLSYPNATDYLQLESKTYNLEVQTASDSKKVLDVPNVRLTANSVESVFAFGSITGKPALSTLTVIDRRGTGTPATGAEQSFGFIALAAGMVAATGFIFRKIARIQENS